MIKDRHGEIGILREKAEAIRRRTERSGKIAHTKALHALINKISDDAFDYFILDPTGRFFRDLWHKYREEMKAAYGGASQFCTDEVEELKAGLKRAGFGGVRINNSEGACDLEITL